MIPSVDRLIDIEMKTHNSDPEEYVDLELYRKLVRTHIEMRRYKTALFWAEKVAVLSQFNAVDVFWQAQCMYHLGEYHRAAYIIKLRGYEKNHLLCHYLTAECHFEAKEYQEALEIFNLIDLDRSIDEMNGLMFTGLDEAIGPTKAEIMASICLLRGRVLEAMDNRQLAIDCYVQALHLSVYCTEALDALVQHEMLLAVEERDLINHLPFEQQCTDAEAKVLKKLYKAKLKKYYETMLPASLTDNNQTSVANVDRIKKIMEITQKTVTDRTSIETKRANREATPKLFSPAQPNIQSPANKIYNELKTAANYSIHASLSKHGTPNAGANVKLNNERNRKADLSHSSTGLPISVCFDRLTVGSIDLLVEKAEILFYRGEFKKCVKLLDELLLDDPYHAGALIVLIGSLMELREHNKLFCVAHKLVDLYSDQAISWYAVGCYYDLIGKSDPARRYLSKATSIDRIFGPAWLAYGHSFAKENEHDQAMAAYFKATQLMRGSHLPLLYIGVENGLTKNMDLAEKFFYQALSVAPLDVFVLHELGAIKFEFEKFEEAEEILRATLGIVMKMAEDNNDALAPRWEPLLNNLGHACRKNKRYDDALKYHRQALVLNPNSASTFSAMGFIYALKGNLELAVEYLHRSLALRRDDVVTSNLLKSCIEEMMDDGPAPIEFNDSPLPSTSVPINLDFTEPSAQKPFNPIPRCKINFDDDSTTSNSSEVVDNSLDMSMDV